MCQKWVRFSCLSVQNRISILSQYPLLYTLDYIFSNVVTIAWLLVIIFSSLGNPILFHVFFYFLYFCWKSSEKVTNFSVFTRFKRNGKKMHKNKIYIRIRHIKISENMIFHPFWVTSILFGNFCPTLTRPIPTESVLTKLVATILAIQAASWGWTFLKANKIAKNLNLWWK